MLTRLALVAAVALLAAGCGGGEEDAPPALEQVPAADAPATPEAATTEAEAQPAPTQAPIRRISTAAARVDEPFITADTGTVRPGMTEADVVAVWGETVTRRDEGIYSYLFFRNGCEASCGMYDVVILEGGQVVDAVVRFPGHHYDGVSSSPPGREPVSTPPTMDRLTPPADR